MPHQRYEADACVSGRAQPNRDLALIVSSSPINRIVVGAIAERAGLKVVSETPDNAASTLLSRQPGTVILDGGADDRECEGLLESLASQRQASASGGPVIILLSNHTPAAGEPAGQMIDAMVAKPITPDRLQPLIQSMVERLRD